LTPPSKKELFNKEIKITKDNKINGVKCVVFDGLTHHSLSLNLTLLEKDVLG